MPYLLVEVGNTSVIIFTRANIFPLRTPILSS